MTPLYNNKKMLMLFILPAIVLVSTLIFLPVIVSLNGRHTLSR